jgi:hypothetical protein
VARRADKRRGREESCLVFDSPAQRDAVTHGPYSAIHIAATAPVIDPIAIADIEATSAAILPDRVLHEPGKGLGKAGLNCRASIRSATAAIISAQPPGR